jgi:DNA-binding transcriptional ArsR family regulator
MALSYPTGALMSDSASLAKLASLIADPSRATMLTTLLSGRAYTATELADAAQIGRPAASAQLSRLVDAGLLGVVSQGRHRFFRFRNEQSAESIERLLGIASRVARCEVLTGPKDSNMRYARTCYDHLAGEAAVGLLDRLLAAKVLCYDGPALTLAASAREGLAALEIDWLSLHHGDRPLCRACLDWSMRRDHIAGRLGRVILENMLEKRWASRSRDSRVITFSKAGHQKFLALGMAS